MVSDRLDIEVICHALNGIDLAIGDVQVSIRDIRDAIDSVRGAARRMEAENNRLMGLIEAG